MDEAVLRQIDKEIPYHILFLLEYGGKYQAWTAYKEAVGGGSNAFKVESYYHTDWIEEVALSLKLDGLNTDQVYENFVRQIAALQVKVRRERQLNKQVQLNTELKRLKKELEEL